MSNHFKWQPTKLRQGDEVIVNAGKEKGKTGTIESFDRKKCRAFVKGLNISKRHLKPNMRRDNQEGGIVDKAMSIHVSNLNLADPKTKEAAKIGYKVENGKKTRFSKKSGTLL